MSTRSMIGVYTDENRQTFEAVYCHWDGYPEGVGQTLVHNWRNTFNGDTQKIVDFLMSTKIGWSSLCGTDFSKAPTWEPCEEDTPRWYDDRPDEEPAERITQEDWTDSWCEYAYLFDAQANALYVYDLHKAPHLLGIVTPIDLDPNLISRWG